MRKAIKKYYVDVRTKRVENNASENYEQIYECK